MLEIWVPVPIPEFRDFYKVSSLGRVRRCTPGRGTRLAQALKPCGRPYHHVVLSGGPGVIQQVRVHVLVALAFLGPCPKGQEVNHKDGNKTSNALSNLEYTTHSGNMQHAHDMGLWTCPNRNGEANGSAKLTNQQVREIFAAAQSDTTTAVAKRFNTTRDTVYSIKTKRSWRGITCP